MIRTIDIKVCRPPFLGDKSVTNVLPPLTTFAKICLAGMSLIQNLAPDEHGFHNLYQDIVAQYYHHVLSPALRSAENKNVTEEEKTMILLARKEITNVQHELVQSRPPKEEWQLLTVFDLVYAGLAFQFGAEAGMRRRMENGPQWADIEAWLELTRNTHSDEGKYKSFHPAAVTFDLKEQIVATSCPYFGGNGGKWVPKSKGESLRHWEQALRAARTAEAVRTHLHELEQALGSSKALQSRTLSQQERINEAIRIVESKTAGEDLCRTLCGRRRWTTVAGKDFKHMDPCASCRVFFSSTEMAIERKPGDLCSSRPAAWQCAECGMMSQLYDIQQARSSNRANNQVRSGCRIAASMSVLRAPPDRSCVLVGVG